MALEKVFLGSSSQFHRLVNWLARELRDRRYQAVDWKFDGFTPGQSTTASLLRNCAECDLCVLFLTPDDAVVKGNALRAKTLYAPRDNCIFEAGLFVGALGLNPERCVLVSSVEQAALPSDLLGLTLVNLPRASIADLSETWLDRHMQPVLSQVLRKLETMSQVVFRPVLTVLTQEQLLDRERLGRNKLKRGESVIVSSAEPVEQDNLTFATAVINNIFHRIKYLYFFKGSEGGSFRWIELIRTLVLAGVATRDNSVRDQDLTDEHLLLQVLDDHAATALDIIEELRKYLRIYLLHDSQRLPHQLKICVHNAQSEQEAACYFRHRIRDAQGQIDYFVLWYQGKEAKALVEDLLQLKDQPPGSAIFCSTPLFNLHPDKKDENGEGYRTQLAIAQDIKRLFPRRLEEAVLKASLSHVAKKAGLKASLR